ncbi:MAG: peptidylprolyl isomerase [bacterium]|nr:peptidylprolyl isomerase [bacterium]
MVIQPKRLCSIITIGFIGVCFISPVSAQLFKKKPKPAVQPTAVSTSTATTASAPSNEVSPADIIVATYRGGKYTGQDLQSKLKSLDPYTRLEMEEEGNETEAIKRLVKEAVRDRVLYAEAIKNKLDQDPLFKSLVEDREDRLMVDKLYQREVLSKATVTEDDIRNYYNTHINEFTNPQGDQFKIRYIFVDTRRKRTTDEEKAEGLKKILEAYQKLKEGNDFVEVAKEYSESEESLRGQVAGPFARDTILKEIETAALSLKPGEFSSIITTKHGYNIVRLEEFIPAVTPYEKAKAAIQGRVLFEKRQQIANEAQKRIFDSVTTYKNIAALESLAGITTAKETGVQDTTAQPTSKKEKKYLADVVADYAKKTDAKSLAEFVDKFSWSHKSNPILLSIVRLPTKSDKKQTFLDFLREGRPQDRYIFTLNDMRLRQNDPRFAPMWANLDAQKRSLDQLAQIKTFAMEARIQGLDKDPDIVKQVQEFKEKELANKMLNQKVDARLTVSDKDIEEFYARNSSWYMTQKEIFARVILIKAPRENPMQLSIAKDSCWEIYSKLTAGANFIELAQEYSQGPNPEKGGEIGWVFMGPSGYLFDTAAFALKKGEFSVPVPLKQGYGIIKVDDIREPRLQTLDEVRNNVKEGVMNEKRMKLTQLITDEILASVNFQLDEKQMLKAIP